MDLRRISILFFVATLHIECASAVDAQRAGSVIGCYAVDVGTWSGPFPSGLTAEHQPPQRIRLDSTRVVQWNGDSTSWRRLEPSIPAIAARSRLFTPGWQPAGGDSLRLSWSTGLAGVNVLVAVRADSLRGTAYAWHDFIGPVQPTAPVLLRRVQCTP